MLFFYTLQTFSPPYFEASVPMQSAEICTSHSHHETKTEFQSVINKSMQSIGMQYAGMPAFLLLLDRDLTKGFDCVPPAKTHEHCLEIQPVAGILNHRPLILSGNCRVVQIQESVELEAGT